MKKYVIILSFFVLIYISQAALQAKQTLLQQTIEHNNTVYSECFWPDNIRSSTTSSWSIERTLSDTERYRQATNCWKSQRRNTPDDLFLTVPKYLVDEGKCSISQSEDDHVSKARWGMYATDLACNFKEQGVYAPDYLNDMKEYVIESVWTDALLGNFVILSFKDNMEPSNIQSWWQRWYFGHTILNEWFKVGDTIHTWIRFARADLSGATTWWHTHIELRRSYDGVWQSVRYVTRFKELALEKKRTAIPVANAAEENTYYFTAYNLGDPAQNDKSPCIGASWKDLCKLEAAWVRTMAVTSDIRKKLWIKFWDKVALTGEIWCEWLYQVEDEMNLRFRENCILRPWTSYCIKWDIPSKKWGACKIEKL